MRDGRLRGAVALAWLAGRKAVTHRLVLAAAGAVVPLAAAWLTKTALDRLVEPNAPALRVAVPAVALAVCGVLLAVLPRFVQYTDAELSRQVTLFARNRLFTAVDRLKGLGRLEDPRFHDRLQLAVDAGPNGPSQVLGGTLSVCQGTVVAGGFVVALAAMSPWAMLIVVAAAIPALHAELRLSRAAPGWRCISSPPRGGSSFSRVC